MRPNFLRLVGLFLLLGASPVWAQDAEPPFGGEADVSFARRLWEALQEVRLVGPNAVESRPYEGVEPHGAILTTLQTTVAIDGREGAAIVKNNYLGENVSVTSVADNPRLNLDAITVMFRREAGYDPETRNWFWAKYNRDGTLSVNPRGAQMAGRISRNPEDGCIACHQFAPGNDYVFLNDRFAVPDAVAFKPDTTEGVRAIDLRPSESLSDTDGLEPGLNVRYFYNIFNLVAEVREFATVERGDAGTPLPTLDYNVGSGRVLTSERADGVGAIIDGFINFPEPGIYTMAVQSNDGIEVNIAGVTVFSDPVVHADRFSDLVAVRVDQPGWYPLDVIYFEKRNTATLELYWQPPGSDDGLNFVPSDALARHPG